MGSKTRLSPYCSKRGDNTVNLVTSRKTNSRLERPIVVTLYLRAKLGEESRWQHGGVAATRPRLLTPILLLVMNRLSIRII